jgi:hypothetical protein
MCPPPVINVDEYMMKMPNRVMKQPTTISAAFCVFKTTS